jgi:mannosylglycerate hydrolase MGH1-like protein
MKSKPAPDQVTAELNRLAEARDRGVPWKKWGPYLSERQWGTVREDYSEGGDAWNYFTHDQARSRAYRWGEDGLAGICDERQRLCFALALWNGKDPILKERLRLFGTPSRTPYVKDGIDSFIVHGCRGAVNPEQTATKAAAHYPLTVGAGESRTVRLRIHDAPSMRLFGKEFDAVIEARRKEADEFYSTVIPDSLDADAANVMRQALAGMLWTKQFYYYDVDRWLEERGADPFKPQRRRAPRNEHWHHVYNAEVISMPDKWEYPWYAAWDLAFHVLSLTLVDEDFGKQQLDLMLRNPYMHPNGQIPAYEWNFGDVNPPVHAWATIFTYRMDLIRRGGKGDLDWLEQIFHKLVLNFTWWVNRKDRSGNNAFEGGFLGLDNIGVFDRSAPLPTGGYLEQADGTAWMALFCQNMTEIVAELATHRPTYVPMALKFLEHFLWIANALIHVGDNTGMWDEQDGFFYDVLRLPDGRAERLKVRSMVGLLPLCAVTVFDGKFLQTHPEMHDRYKKFLEARSELTGLHS